MNNYLKNKFKSNDYLIFGRFLKWKYFLPYAKKPKVFCYFLFCLFFFFFAFLFFRFFALFLATFFALFSLSLSLSIYIYIYIHTHIYIEREKVKLAIVVEGNLNAPFSIATTPICRRGCNSLLWIILLYPWFALYNAECLARRCQVSFLSLSNNSTWDLTPVSWTIGDHSTHYIYPKFRIESS